MSAPIPDGRVFHRKLLLQQSLFSFPALVIVLSYLWVLIEMTSAEWWWFLGAIATWTVLSSPIQMTLDRRRVAPVIEYLDLRSAGAELAPEQVRAAFRTCSGMPKACAFVGFLGWFLPTLVVGAVMTWRWEIWGGYESLAMILAGAQAGIVSAVFTQFSVKKLSDGVLTVLAGDLPDPDQRAELSASNTMREKLMWCVTFTAIVPVMFAALLFHSESRRSVEEFVVRVESDAIELVANGGDPEQARLVLTEALPRMDGQLVLERLDPAAGKTAGIEREILAEVDKQLDAGAESGDSVGLPSARHFAWLRGGDGTLWVASLPVGATGIDDARLWTILLVLLLAAAAVAGGLAWLISSDASQAARRLCDEADRLASGDLRPGEVFESPDELGELGRAFDRMGRYLRETIGRVASAADGVEATAGAMASVSSSVSSVTADQVAGIRQTTQSMETINAQVRGIADSAQALNVSVEESSSSILELGAAGEELNETASVLSGKVNEVSSSIEQMVRSVKQVLENTEALSEAAVETSASMGEMATSMREVDSSAEETARLSREVVESAESGQAKMVQTIEGMDAIREATETAERVIRSLGGRASEIGAIVDVIDDVADETNLLALNAAIIAAQAGEQGRAFSVVADEIKDLADRVLASTKEIGAQIRAVQEESENAIGAIERGTQSVAGGVDLTAEAGVSLEEITRASRESGQRIAGIVSAVREQARAASHVVELMERVRGGVEEIRSAAVEQDRGNEVVFQGSVAMRDVASQVRGTTEEQARGSGRIRESVEGVREAVEQINSALQEQSASCRTAVEFLEAMHARTRSNEESATRLDAVVRDLARQAESLREDIGRFRIS